MEKRTPIALTVLALFLAGTSAANAASAMRCNGKIIDTGVSLGYVLAQCGEPEFHTTREVPVRTRNALGYSSLSGTSVAEFLIYDRGVGRFPAELHFVNGKLRRIELLYRQR